MKYPLACSAAAALLLAGCSTASAQVSSAPSPARSVASTTAAPAGSPSGSASRFAAVITAREKAWRDYDAGTAKCDKAAQGTGPDDFAASMACIKSAQAVAASAQDATNELTALSPPPPELRSLVARTLKALAPLKNSNARTNCRDATSDACDASVQQVSDAISSLVDVLDDWDASARPQ
ncbi:hypothetical protein KIH31_04855 [Paenarthrobacter sp. DKR-5]|uniref:hypothetical protein n=1 Tax=Paenarthrobacter sp. DKR-5 TaxID=2835535 RepID=UPI001BDD7774|nr:hypothetical protein [Paenarthrobacter sp. DKR-5]MBT1001927.1 hypothetical protein [Paenarthrobacter sp. DKR-5]